MSLGPLMVGIQGTSLLAEEREMLSHPLIGGVILFSRNYESLPQLRDLTQQLHKLRHPHLIVAVDHEGGVVQRFREGFTPIPPMEVLGEMYVENSHQAVELSEKAGWLLATELLSAGLDISFAPVLDIAGNCAVIGNRAFSPAPETIATLGQALMRGMNRAGMTAIGKHFPGHGGVKEDSHITLPVDSRSLEDLLFKDILPFERLVHLGLAGIMASHIIYEQVDDKPAGFSKRWLQDILRLQIGFQGAIFSDDMGMKGAEWAGSYPERTQLSLDAGCDMVLLCNDPLAVVEVLDNLDEYKSPAGQMRLIRMHGHPVMKETNLSNSTEWQTVSRQISEINR